MKLLENLKRQTNYTTLANRGLFYRLVSKLIFFVPALFRGPSLRGLLIALFSSYFFFVVFDSIVFELPDFVAKLFWFSAYIPLFAVPLFFVARVFSGPYLSYSSDDQPRYGLSPYLLDRLNRFLYPMNLDPGGFCWFISLIVFFVVSLATIMFFSHGCGQYLYGGLVFDSISVPFIFLTASIIPVVVLASLDPVKNHSDRISYFLSLIALEGLLILCFSARDLLVFYLIFEALAFPMFLLVGTYGPRVQRLQAAYKFFFYTFLGSAFMIPLLVYLYFERGCTDFDGLRSLNFSEVEEITIFICLFIPLAVKIPSMPLHLWLPEAHVEAPTPVSMILAALLLKTGGYAFLRFVFPAVPFGCHFWTPLVNCMGVCSIIAASLYALAQVDVKKMIAYASVAHMNVVLLGLFSSSVLGYQGSVYLMLAHGYTSAGLFAGIGVLYDRYHTRTIRYFGGLVYVMPFYTFLFFLLTLGNVSFPFTGGFAGEFMVLSTLTASNYILGYLSGLTVFLSLCYSFWLFNRVFHLSVSTYISGGFDLTEKEVAVLVWCVFWMIFLGFTAGLFSEVTMQDYSRQLYTYLGHDKLPLC